jgi:hypothetical protein
MFDLQTNVFYSLKPWRWSGNHLQGHFPLLNFNSHEILKCNSGIQNDGELLGLPK